MRANKVDTTKEVYVDYLVTKHLSPQRDDKCKSGNTTHNHVVKRELKKMLVLY